MAKKCKSKKLNLRKYKSGSQLPKLSPGGVVSYNQQNAATFTPQVDMNAPGNQALGGTNNQVSNAKYSNGVATVNGKNVDSSSGLNSGTLSQIGGYAGAAGSLINSFDDGKVTGSETQNVVDQVGSNFAFYSAGKVVDETLLPKDEKTGLYGSDLEASLSYGLTDPAQQLSQSVDDFNEGEYLQSIVDFSMPGLAGIEYQSDQKKEVAAQEAKLNEQMSSAKLNQLNSKMVNYDYAKFGGQLKRFNNGGKLTPKPVNTPTVLNSDIYGYKPGSEGIVPYNNNLEISSMKGYSRGRLGTYKGQPLYDNLQKTPPAKPGSEFIPRNLTQESSILEISNRSGIPIEIVRQNMKTNPKGTIEEFIKTPGNSNFQYREDSTNQPSMIHYYDKKEMGGQINDNKRLIKKPIVRKYGGQTHEGPDEGIPVDQNGNPSAMTGRKPIALTEKGEVVYNGYVFSDSIKHKNK